MKISETEREEVKRMYFEQGMTRKDIASTKGLSQRYVSAIIHNTDMGHGYRTTGRRKPSGEGAVMNVKRIVPGKADKNTDVSDEPVAVPVRREHDSNQDAADQTQSDTVSKYV